VFIMKIIGGILTVGASAAIGACLGERRSRQAASLDELREALCVLKSRISFGHDTIPEAMAAAGRAGGSWETLFHRAEEGFLRRSGETAAEIWAGAVAGVVSDTEDAEKLRLMGMSLGHADPAPQAEGISFVIDYLGAKIERLSEAGARESKLYNSLGALCGALAAVLLL
jgi:stage III sporulation protein AB